MKKSLFWIVVAIWAGQIPVARAASRPEGFVAIADVDPTLRVEMRYFGSHNFIGRPIKGYKAPICYLTKDAAQAIAAVQKELKQKLLSLKVYDCYRPQRAVNDFARWAKDLNDIKMKKEFYPEEPKETLFERGYIAHKSGHSRGSTVDLTIDGLDMGSPYDFFGTISNTDDPRIRGKQRKNRQLLKTVMEKYGFKNYEKEWWHYTLKNEPYPKKYFDFVVK